MASVYASMACDGVSYTWKAADLLKLVGLEELVAALLGGLRLGLAVV